MMARRTFLQVLAAAPLALHAALSRASKPHDAHKRSPHWPKVEKAHLAAHPACDACGAHMHLQVHHVSPFHLHPELELDDANLVTLCMDSNRCHLLIGHGDNWKQYNPNLRLHLGKILSGSISLGGAQTLARSCRTE